MLHRSRLAHDFKSKNSHPVRLLCFWTTIVLAVAGCPKPGWRSSQPGDFCTQDGDCTSDTPACLAAHCDNNSCKFESKCSNTQVCDNNQCCAQVVHNSCGQCGTGQYDCNGNCIDGPCSSPTPDACIPNCDGRGCGSDGCGGTCVCRSDTTCTDGSCVSCLRYWHRDADGDGFGSFFDADLKRSCERPSGYVSDGTDCDDTRANVHPGPETCGDGIDNNCSGACDENCFNLVIQKALCPGQSQRSCADNLLTYDINEGGAGGDPILFVTYKTPIPGVTTDRPLLRCYVNGYHFVTMGDNNCANIEGSFGYPMTFMPTNGSRLMDCYTDSTDPQHSGQLEQIQRINARQPLECTGRPPRANGPWKRFDDFGFSPAYSGPNATNTISSCWGR
jgi:putative metal-binding protein